MNFELFISTGFFAAIIASVCSLLINYVNRKDTKLMESDKKNFDVQKYRYQKLHEYLEQMSRLPLMTYDIFTNEGLINMRKESSERFYKIKSISYAVAPILDSDLQVLLKNSFEKVAEASKALDDEILAKKEYGQDVLFPLVKAQDAYERELIAAAQKQLERLLIS
ncbi:MAG: hypothetical protein FWE92_00965 [Defluviitaleaceae bacterium]|nr:hypothetical protein [Defluviitaleaceae bacterium]